MSTVYLVPAGSDSAPGAQDGDYLLRRKDDLFEVGRLEGPCTWFGSVQASLLPSLPADVQEAQEAPEQEAVLTAVRGIETAEDTRGG